MSDTLSLFHVTSATNALAIIRDGYVDPALGKAHPGRQWFAKMALVDTLIAFQMYRHKVPLREVVVFKCEVQKTGLQDGARLGKYSSPFRAPVLLVYTMPEWIALSLSSISADKRITRRGWGYGTASEG